MCSSLRLFWKHQLWKNYTYCKQKGTRVGEKVQRPGPSTFQRHTPRKELQWRSQSGKCSKRALHRNVRVCCEHQEPPDHSSQHTCTYQALQMVSTKRPVRRLAISGVQEQLWRKLQTVPATETPRGFFFSFMCGLRR